MSGSASHGEQIIYTSVNALLLKLPALSDRKEQGRIKNKWGFEVENYPNSLEPRVYGPYHGPAHITGGAGGHMHWITIIIATALF